MKKGLFTICFCSLLMSNVWAEVEVLDPNGILEISDAYLGKRTFEESFQCGDRAELFEQDCVEENGNLNCRAQTSSSEIVECSESEVSVESISMTRSEIQRFSKEEFDQTKGNVLRMLLLENGLSKILDSNKNSQSRITFLNHSFVSNEYLGKKKVLMQVSMIIEFCRETEGCYPISSTALLSNEKAALSQLAQFHMINDDWQFTSGVSKFTRK